MILSLLANLIIRDESFMYNNFIILYDSFYIFKFYLFMLNQNRSDFVYIFDSLRHNKVNVL